MPPQNVKVYVPARDADQLRDEGHDVGEWVRGAVKVALENRADGDPVASRKAPPDEWAAGAREAAERGEPVTLIHELAGPRAGGVRVEVPPCTAPVGTKCKIHGKVCNPRRAA